MNDQAIVVSGLEKRYGAFAAVRSFDLTVPRGEVFALLGPNGAGKTTTVEILEGIRPRSRGTVSVLGQDPADYTRSFRDRVGVVPQTTSAFDDLTLVELLRHFAKVYSRPLPVAEVVALVGLESKATSLCRNMSGGQRRRVDLALALIGDPDLIFLDEPTTGLDPEVRRQAWDVVKLLTGRGKTILLTTHYLDEAEELAARVGIMVGGSLLEVGRPDEIGGRRNAAVTVSFRRPAALTGVPLPLLPAGSRVHSDDGLQVELRVSAPTAATRVVLDWAAAHGVDEIPALKVHQPSLEEIYLQMIAAAENNPAASEATRSAPSTRPTSTSSTERAA